MLKRFMFGISALLVGACFLTYIIDSATPAYGKTVRRVQEASDAVISPLALPTAPGTWTGFNTPGTLGGKASMTRLAGGSGVKHVATCAIVTLTNFNASSGGVDILQLRDGASGSGSVLMQWYLAHVPGNPGYTHFELCGLNIVGSANTPMTLEFTSGSPNAYQTVALVGYEAN